MTDGKESDELSDFVDKEMRNDDAGSVGIRTITEVKDTASDGKSDIELKTNLTNNQVVDHSMVEFLTKVLQKNDPKAIPIITGLTEKKERKLISLQGLSRRQVVEMTQGTIQKELPKKGFFQSRM